MKKSMQHIMVTSAKSQLSASESINMFSVGTFTASTDTKPVAVACSGRRSSSQPRRVMACFIRNLKVQRPQTLSSIFGFYSTMRTAHSPPHFQFQKYSDDCYHRAKSSNPLAPFLKPYKTKQQQRLPERCYQPRRVPGGVTTCLTCVAMQPSMCMTITVDGDKYHRSGSSPQVVQRSWVQHHSHILEHEPTKTQDAKICRAIVRMFGGAALSDTVRV